MIHTKEREKGSCERLDLRLFGLCHPVNRVRMHVLLASCIIWMDYTLNMTAYRRVMSIQTESSVYV